MLDFLVGAGLIIGVLVGLPLLLWITVAGWRSGHLSSRPGMIALGVILTLGAIWLFWPKDGLKQMPALDVVFSFGLLIVLAILAIMGRGGWPTRLALAFVVLGLLFLGPTGFFSGYSDFQKGAKEVVLEGKPILSASAPEAATPAANTTGTETIIELGLNQCSEPVAVKNGQCLLRREEVLEKITFRTEVFNTSTQSWERLPAGGFKRAFWWRFCGVTENAKAFYTIYPQPSGGCK